MSVIPTSFWGFLSAGLVAAVFHALLPNHWFPFLAAGRFHHWTRKQLFGFTFVIATAHALVTLGLGVLVVLLGHGIAHFLQEKASKVAGIILLLLGFFFIASPRLYGHRHIHHPECEHNANQTITAAGLFLALALSPCEGLLPIFFAASVKFGWENAMLIAALSSIVTVVLLVSIVMAAHMGLERGLQKLGEKHERFVVSTLLIILGLLMLLGKWH